MKPRRGSDFASSGVRRPARAAASIVLAVLTSAALPTGDAAAQGLQVAPTRIAAEVRPGDRLPAIELRNRSRETLTIDVAVAAADQELSGLPRFDLSPASLRDGRRVARVSPSKLRLAPGKTRAVRVTVGRPVRRRVGVYGVVAFTARVAQQTDDKGAVVTPSVRLTTNLLLRYPGPIRRDGRITGLRVEQGAGRTLRFLAPVRNDGNLHVRPRARLTVVDDRGKRVVSRPFRLENVLPDAERELVFDLTKVLQAGSYRAQVDARVGARRSVQTTAFRLVGPNELPTPKLEISALDPPRPDAGRAFDVRVKIRNTGTAAMVADGGLTVSQATGSRLLARRAFAVPKLPPGEAAIATVPLPALDDGRYALTARLRADKRTLSERTVVFATGTRPSLLERALDWMAAHVPLLLAIFAVVLALIAGTLGAYIRRLRRTVSAAG